MRSGNTLAPLGVVDGSCKLLAYIECTEAARGVSRASGVWERTVVAEVSASRVTGAFGTTGLPAQML